jgi:hypothetical protein
MGNFMETPVETKPMYFNIYIAYFMHTDGKVYTINMYAVNLDKATELANIISESRFVACTVCDF